MEGRGSATQVFNWPRPGFGHGKRDPPLVVRPI